MKICLIGDSHTAMLIAALREDSGGEHVTVFAKPGLAKADMALEGTVLRADSRDMIGRLADLGTPTSLDLADFNAVVIAGLAPSGFAAVRLQQGHAVSGWPSGDKVVAASLAETPHTKARPLMTRAAYRAALLALCETSLATRIARAAPCPVTVIPQPFPSDALLDQKDRYPVMQRVLVQGDGPALAEDLVAAHSAAFNALPRTTYLPQPSDTLSHGCLTQGAFMRAGPRLSGAASQDRDDVLHGNTALGLRLLATLRASQTPSVKTPSNP